MSSPSKVALVTGGSAGFGQAVALKFLSLGYGVIVFDLNPPAEPFTAQAAVVLGSVTKREDWERAVGEAKQRWGRLDVVVNNAGINMTGKDTHLVEESFYDRLMEINLKSVFHSISACTPIMLAQQSGVFIHISSVGALRPKPKIAYYCATKAAVIAISKSIAAEYAPYIRSIAIAPSIGNTGMMSVNLGEGKEVSAANIAPFLANIPMGRACEPSDVANMVCFLASDDAGYITGNVVEVDGGRCI